MKLLVIQIDGIGAAQFAIGEAHGSLAALAQAGGCGPLAGALPPGAIPGGLALASGRDPGALGIYAACQRASRGQYTAAPLDPRSAPAPAIWNLAAQAGRKAALLSAAAGDDSAVAQAPEVLDAAGWSAVFDRPGPLDPDTIAALVGRAARALSVEGCEYVHLAATLGRLPEEAATAGQAELDRLAQAQLAALDAALGGLLESFGEDTAILIASAYGWAPCRRGLALNRWLADSGYLVLRADRPATAPPAERIDWSRTRAWADEGTLGRLYLNVAGREASGVVAPGDCAALRSELAGRLEQLADPQGISAAVAIIRPEETFTQLTGVAPDLLIGFEQPGSRVVADLDQEVWCEARGWHATPDGVLLVATPHAAFAGALEGARAIDVVPTLLELGGCGPVAGLSGRSLLGRGADDLSADEEELIRQRLSGLGYIA